jgi:hypothetical protein
MFATEAHKYNRDFAAGGSRSDPGKIQKIFHFTARENWQNTRNHRAGLVAMGIGDLRPSRHGVFFRLNST